MSEGRNHSVSFKKYLRGELSPEEAHAFERSSLEDPFVLEALEGFEEQGVERLNDLAKLQRKMERRRNGVWWQYAGVAAIVLACFYVVFLSLTGFDQGQQLAEQSQAKEVQEGLNEDTTAMQIEVPARKEVAEDEIELEEHPLSVDIVNDVDVSKKEVAAEASQAYSNDAATATEDLPNFPEAVETPPAKADTEDSYALFGEAPDLQDEVMDTQNVDMVAREMLQGRTSGAQVETKMNSIAAIEEFEPQEISEEKQEKIEATMATEAELQEAVVEALSIKKRSTGSEFAPAEPRGGTRAYEVYLQENMNYPAAAREEGIEGTVVVQLTISPRGKMEQLVVKRSLGYGCDEEALRLIQQGPNWDPAESDGAVIESQVLVRVTFRL